MIRKEKKDSSNIKNIGCYMVAFTCPECGALNEMFYANYIIIAKDKMKPAIVMCKNHHEFDINNTDKRHFDKRADHSYNHLNRRNENGSSQKKPSAKGQNTRPARSTGFARNQDTRYPES